MDKEQQRREQAERDLRNWADNFVAVRPWLLLGHESNRARLVEDLFLELRSAYFKGAADGATDVAEAFREGR
jgi:hypothetical protein